MEKTRMTVRIPDRMDQLLTQVSEERGKSKNAIIIDACWDFIEKYKAIWDMQERRKE